jgi:hypothetical protein
MKYSNKVRINEEKNPGAKTTKNPHAVDNVNAKQGPRTGNQGLTATKRKEFSAAKETRTPLADMITGAFASRGEKTKDFINSGIESIKSTVNAKFKK